MLKPSVLFINRVYPPVTGATGRVLRDLARAFAREGWTVTIITCGPKPGTVRDGGVRVIRVRGAARPRGALSHTAAWIRLLAAALRQPATDLIVTLTDPPMLVTAGRIVQRVKKNRHIHWCHDLYPDIFPAIGVKMPGFAMDWLRKVSRRSMAACDKNIVVGRCMAQYLAGRGVDARQITVIPNWPDPELTVPAEDDMPFAANGNGSINGAKPYAEQVKDQSPKFRVLYAGNIGRAHPMGTILDAAQILDRDNPEIEFVFVGDGPRFDEIARERTRRGLNNIRLLPFQPQTRLRQVMESGDVHIVSMREGAAGLLVPSKLYAALAVGRPCIFIGPGESETAEVIAGFNAGAVVMPGDGQGLAETIRRYRINGEDWFAAHSGAVAAGKIFQPGDAINAWIERAETVVGRKGQREA